MEQSDMLAPGPFPPWISLADPSTFPTLGLDNLNNMDGFDSLFNVDGNLSTSAPSSQNMDQQQRKRKNPWDDDWAAGLTYNQQQYRPFGFGGFQPTLPWQPYPYQLSQPPHFGCPMNSACIVCQFSGYSVSMMQPPSFQTYNDSAGYIPYGPPPQQIYTGLEGYVPYTHAPFQHGYMGPAGYGPSGYGPYALAPPPPPPPPPTYYPPVNNHNWQWYQGAPGTGNFSTFAPAQQSKIQFSNFPNYKQNGWMNLPQIGYNQLGSYENNIISQQQPPPQHLHDDLQMVVDTIASPTLDHQTSNMVSWQQSNETTATQAKLLQVPAVVENVSIANLHTETASLAGENNATSDQSLFSVEKSTTNLQDLNCLKMTVVQSVSNPQKVIKHEPEITTATRIEAQQNTTISDQSLASAKKPAANVQDPNWLKRFVIQSVSIPPKVVKREPEVTPEPILEPAGLTNQFPQSGQIIRSMSKAKAKDVDLPKRAFVHKEIKAIKSTAVPAFGGFCSIASEASRKINKEPLDAVM